MNNLSLIAIFLIVPCLAVRAVEPDFSKMSDEQLVDSLQSIKEETVGIQSLAVADAFLATDETPTMKEGVIGTPAPVSYPQMKILVQRGLKALPTLLQHLDDARPTGLSLPSSTIIMWCLMAEEYAPRETTFASPGRLEPERFDKTRPMDNLPYVVKVGDVCFALVGQIVGRPLNPVRYQPTGGMIINSPVATPELAERVRKDWSGLTARSFLAQLIKDANAAPDSDAQKPALQRLHYFFPNDYVREEDGKVRPQTEAAEKSGK